MISAYLVRATRIKIKIEPSFSQSARATLPCPLASPRLVSSPLPSSPSPPLPAVEQAVYWANQFLFNLPRLNRLWKNSSPSSGPLNRWDLPIFPSIGLTCWLWGHEVIAICCSVLWFSVCSLHHETEEQHNSKPLIADRHGMWIRL